MIPLCKASMKLWKTKKSTDFFDSDSDSRLWPLTQIQPDYRSLSSGGNWEDGTMTRKGWNISVVRLAQLWISASLAEKNREKWSTPALDAYLTRIHSRYVWQTNVRFLLLHTFLQLWCASFDVANCVNNYIQHSSLVFLPSFSFGFDYPSTRSNLVGGGNDDPDWVPGRRGESKDLSRKLSLDTSNKVSVSQCCATEECLIVWRWIVVRFYVLQSQGPGSGRVSTPKDQSSSPTGALMRYYLAKQISDMPLWCVVVL